MKAAFFMKNGGPEVMQYGDVPDPVAGPGQVLVDVHAASVNGADWKVRTGHYAPITTFPYIPGRDFSGVVSALGAGVSDLKVGDPVFGVVEVTGEACYAEKVAIRSAIVAKKPDSLTHVEAASLALIGLTALVSIEDTLKLKSGETILIQGGAGGVAGFAVQVAKHIGARVITTASAANHDYLRKLGADQIIDYTQAGLHEGRVGLRRGVRYRRRRRDQALVRRAAAGRARCVHRLGTHGAGPAAQRRRFAASQGRARPRASRADRRAGHRRRGARAGDQGLSAVGGRRGSPAKRGTPPARQARLQSALGVLRKSFTAKHARNAKERKKLYREGRQGREGMISKTKDAKTTPRVECGERPGEIDNKYLN